MDVAEAVINVISSSFPPFYPRSRITFLVIHSFSNILIHFMKPLHFNNDITDSILFSSSKSIREKGIAFRESYHHTFPLKAPKHTRVITLE